MTPIDGFERLATWLDRWADRLACVAVAGTVVLMFALVAARYLFSIGSIAGQEAVQWMHAGAFLLGASVALRADAHVRIDILQQRWSQRTRDWIELIGTIALLLPFCGFIMAISSDYVAASWSIQESSREPGGLPALYLLKSMIPLAALLLALQGLARASSAWRRLRRPADSSNHGLVVSSDDASHDAAADEHSA